jgi:hypothetical protein
MESSPIIAMPYLNGLQRFGIMVPIVFPIVRLLVASPLYIFTGIRLDTGKAYLIQRFTAAILPSIHFFIGLFRDFSLRLGGEATLLAPPRNYNAHE